MLFPLNKGEDASRVYGSVYRDCLMLEKIELNKQRIKILRRWLIRLDETDVCSGSIKSKSDLQAITKKQKTQKPK